MSTINAVNQDINKARDRLFYLQGRMCSHCKRHISAPGYIICLHCIHGGCQTIPSAWIEEVLELEQLLEHV